MLLPSKTSLTTVTDKLQPSPDTMAWWETQPEAWAHATTNPEPAEIVMPRYADWVESLPGFRVFAAAPRGQREEEQRPDQEREQQRVGPDRRPVGDRERVQRDLADGRRARERDRFPRVPRHAAPPGLGRFG